jgi:hypothetical protein
MKSEIDAERTPLAEKRPGRARTFMEEVGRVRLFVAHHNSGSADA